MIMNDDIQAYEWAERYLSGELSEEEKDYVDGRLETDKAFGVEFAKYLIIKQEFKAVSYTHLTLPTKRIVSKNCQVEDGGFGWLLRQHFYC